MISANGSTAPRVYARAAGRLGWRPMTQPPQVIGVVGAGTMGAGIAQLAALAGARTLLYDAAEGAVERALERIPQQLERGAQRGRWSTEDATAAAGRLEAARAPGAAARSGPIGAAAPRAPPGQKELLAKLSPPP